MNSLFSLLSPAGATARLNVFIFHRVVSQPDLLFPEQMHARRFSEVCDWLKSWFNVLPLDEAAAHLKGGTLPAGSACITFDDGYADNHDVALPILLRHGLTATFFIATGFLNGGRMWNDTIIESIRACNAPALDLCSLSLGRHHLDSINDRRAVIGMLIDEIKYRPLQERVFITEKIAHLTRVRLPDDLMMTSQEVRALRQAGMQIGAHTVSHPILARLTDDEVRQEIQDSKFFLEQLLGERVGLFAYPNGKPGEDYTSQNVAVVRGLDFDAAVSTEWGASGVGDDLYQIQRFTPWDQTKVRFGVRVLTNLLSARYPGFSVIWS